MQITCFNDQNTWTVSGLNIAAAKLRFALGFPEETFYCPKCGKGNKVSKANFQAAMNAPNVVAAPKPAGPAAPMPGVAPVVGIPHVGAPFAGPSIATPRHGTVLVRSLHVRKDHSKKSETMAGLVKGQKVDIIATWTDGKDTWAQLGPERWSAIVYNGEALIKLDD